MSAVTDPYYITPHEAALAVVATAMKKARLRLDTLVLNSIVGGVLFSAGGMLHLCAQATNPDIWEKNPGIIHLLQGAVYPIGLFYVITMGAELFNSNILYFSVGVCRGAVSVIDLLISWSVSWICNLGANLFVCYVICHLSGITQEELYVKGSIEIVVDKAKYSFIQTFIKGIAGNFCVCLAVYLQLLAKPIHVKLMVLSLPIFTFVTMGFTHVVADMYLLPMGLINGAPVSVGKYIWKILIPATLGNAVGGSIFGIIIPWYLHLVVVERDRKLLSLPKFDAKDEQPELEMDSRVVRVASTQPQSSSSTDDDEFEEKNSGDIRPTAYRPSDVRRSSQHTVGISRTRSATNSLRSPPGVFPVLGMGEPLSKEKSIASGVASLEDFDDALNDTRSIRSRNVSLKDVQDNEEFDYVQDGGYNARENALGESLKKVLTKSKHSVPHDPETGPSVAHTTKPTIRRSISDSFNEGSTKIFGNVSKSLSQKSPETLEEVSNHLHRHSITERAANASDNIAGIDNYEFSSVSKPGPALFRKSSRR